MGETELGRVTDTDEPLTPQGRAETRCPQFRGHSQPFFRHLQPFLPLLLSFLPHPFFSSLLQENNFFPSMFLSQKRLPQEAVMDVDGRTVWIGSMVDGCLAWSGARKHTLPEERVNPATSPGQEDKHYYFFSLREPQDDVRA